MDLVERVARAVVPIMSGDNEDEFGNDIPRLTYDAIGEAWQKQYRNYARAAIAEVLDAMGEDVSWDVALAGIKGYMEGDPTERFNGSGFGMKDAFKAMLAQFKAENGL